MLFTRSLPLVRQAVASAPSPADRVRSPHTRRRVLIESIVAAICAYIASATFEAALIRSIGPTEWELAWVSDAALATAFGTAVYLWRHLLGTRRELQERERAQLVVQTQLSIAADIQRQLLPPVPPNEFGFEWAVELRSAGKIGGDFYDFVRFSPSVLVVLVADVSGKGIPAAMALGSLRSAFRTIARQSADPARIAAQLSAGLFDEWHGSLYVTCLVSTFDLGQRTLTSTNAGHPAAIVKGRGGLKFLRRGGPPAGLFPDASYERESIRLHTGDVCLIVTDGVTEALDDDSLERHLDRLPMRLYTGSATRLCHAVMTRALAGHGPTDAQDWDDDRTVVVATIGAPESRGPFNGRSAQAVLTHAGSP
jgi:stage II sporulation SpoE-like protein